MTQTRRCLERLPVEQPITSASREANIGDGASSVEAAGAENERRVARQCAYCGVLASRAVVAHIALAQPPSLHYAAL
jgi:hypothetical protein